MPSFILTRRTTTSPLIFAFLVLALLPIWAPRLMALTAIRGTTGVGEPRPAPPHAYLDRTSGTLYLSGGDGQDTLRLATTASGITLTPASAQARPLAERDRGQLTIDRGRPGSAQARPLALPLVALRAIVVSGAAPLVVGALPLADTLLVTSGGPVTLAAPLALPGALRVLAPRLSVLAPVSAAQIDLQVAGLLNLAEGSSLLSTGAVPLTIQADALIATGDIAAHQIALRARAVVQAGTLTAPSIMVAFTGNYQASSGARLDASGPAGGTITLDGGTVGTLFTSATLRALGTTGLGGQIRLQGHTISLAAATLDASGASGGGRISIGGDQRGIAAASVAVNHASSLRADAQAQGDGGRIVVWSAGDTVVGGSVSAHGGIRGGDGGFVELSGRGALQVSASPDVSAPAGNPGRALFDPQNLIVAASGALPQFDLPNPTPAPTDTFGATVLVLSGGNIVVTDPYDDTVVNEGGAVYLFNGLTGGLISTLTGSFGSDLVGNDGVIAVGNGNYVVTSVMWDNSFGTYDVGAVTWGSGTIGVSGAVSDTNSLIGSHDFDQVGNFRVTVLTNGNYVVSSQLWNNGGAVAAGAVTWGDALGGTVGVVDAMNSLVGSTAGDQVGGFDVTPLANGNYVVSSPNWDDLVSTDVGAVTWGDALGGTVGAVAVTNSLVGSTAGDQVGDGGVFALPNSNYVVSSPRWDDPVFVDAGAVTWGSGLGGTVGPVAATNSLVGSTAGDQVGDGGVFALTNSNYVVSSPRWDDPVFVDAGAVTWASGLGGTVGPVAATNSLVGTSASDQVGSGRVVALTNDNYVVNSPLWDAGVVTNVGAVTWADGALGINGPVTAGNSLVGSTTGDRVGGGGAFALAGGNYVVRSARWDDGASADVGAVTWVDGSVGTNGLVSSGNSLVGSIPGDRVGSGGVVVLTNGNYVVRSPLWDDGASADVGAVTWGSSGMGVSGLVDVGNSLIGANLGDQVGSGGVTALIGGNYVVRSPLWDNGVSVDVGAVTWGDGTLGRDGVVVAIQSLVGSTSDDQVGSGGVIALAGGNYVVRSPSWDNGANTNAGAVSFGYADGSTVGLVSVVNSVIGSIANAGLDAVSEDSVNSTFVSSFSGNGGRVVVGFGNASQLTYPRGAAFSITVLPELLTRTLNAGTDLTLQASNDITISDPVIVTSPGGSLTLQAGRSAILNSTLTTGAAALTIIANDTLANGVVDAYRNPGSASVTMGVGSSIDAGAAAVTIDLRDGAGKTNTARDGVTLTTVTGAVSVAGGPLTPGGTGSVGSTSIIGSLTLVNSGLRADIDGTAAGQYDSIAVVGDVNLNGPLVLAGAHIPASGQSFVLIDNDGVDAVSGTFTSLPEGAFSTTLNGINMKISYVGGDGNDVVLAPVTPTPVDLVSFTATRTRAGSVLAWRTASELGVNGFHLLRSLDSQPTSAVRITTNLIPAQGAGVTGASYRWDDTTLVAGATPSYWLQVIGRDGAVQVTYGPVSPSSDVNPSTSTRLFLPLVVK